MDTLILPPDEFAAVRRVHEALSLVLTRCADHDPEAICRPALGNGLCELLTTRDGSVVPGR